MFTLKEMEKWYEEVYTTKMIILHLCCKAGSETRYFDLDDNYVVLKIDEKIGVENFNVQPWMCVVGVYKNPMCTEFSTASYARVPDIEKGMFLVNHCERITKQSENNGHLKWHVLENPARGTLWKYLGVKPYKYQPWEYGASFTKDTGVYGKFNIPKKIVLNRNEVVINPKLYIRGRDTLPSLTLMHKSSIYDIPEWEWAIPFVECDADIRSLSCDGWAFSFYEANK